MTPGELWRRLSVLIHRERFRKELEEEMQLHRELRAQSHEAAGMDAAEAAVVTRRGFGNPAAIAEASREAWGARWFDDLGQDLSYAVRSLAAHPLLALAVALTFALGIGANAAIFSLVDRLFVQTPPGITRPKEIRTLFQTHVNPRILSTPTRWAFSYGDLQVIRGAIRHDLPIAGYTRPWPASLGPIDMPEVAPTYVADDYFGLLGIRPELGRLFTPEETRPDHLATVAVISHHLWMAGFGGDPAIPGRTLTVDGRPFTIIGVTSPGFRGINLAPADLFLPLNAMMLNHAWAGPQRDVQPWYSQGAFLQIVFRVRSDTAARSVGSVVTPALRATDPDDTASVTSLETIPEAFRRDAGGSVVSITTRLAGVALILLLIASANIATLLLARGVARRRELAVRLALGAGRWRLVRQLLTEGLVVALLGGGIAFVVAIWGFTALSAALLPNLHDGAPVLAGRLLAFATVMTIVMGLGTSFLPAWSVSRPDLTSVLQGGARVGVRGRSPVRGALLACQSALSVVLLAGAGLFVRSLNNVKAVDIGYSVDRLILAHVPYDQSESILSLGAKLPDLASRIARLPGAERIALTANPMMTVFRGVPVFLPESAQRLSDRQAHISFVSPEYFATVGTRVLAGRSFSPDDRRGSEPIVVVSQSLATAAWPGEPAVGKCLIVVEPDEPCRTVIGIVADVHVRRILEAPSLQVYLPSLQTLPFPGSAMVIRATPERVRPIAAETQRMFGAAFGTAGSRLVQTMSDVLAPELRPWQLGAGLLTAAGLAALLLAAVGIYTSVTYTVTERTHEIGVRMALGARVSSVLRLIVSHELRVVLLGVLVGVAVTLALGRLVATMLYEITPSDPRVLLAVCLVLVGVAVAACLVPAWRATRIDPVEVLRAE